MAASSSTRQHRTAWFLHLVVDERTPSRLQGVASSIGIERFFGQVLLTLHQVHHADPACRRSCMLFRSIPNDGASCNCCESNHHGCNGSHKDGLAHVLPLPISGSLPRRTSVMTSSAACISAATREMGRPHTLWIGRNTRAHAKADTAPCGGVVLAQVEGAAAWAPKVCTFAHAWKNRAEPLALLPTSTSQLRLPQSVHRHRTAALLEFLA
jgi:hypothetical protein